MAENPLSDKSDPALVLFADAQVESLEASKTLPMKFTRLIKQSNLPEMVGGKSVAIKMHLGGDVGFTTIHPLFVRTLITRLKEAGASKVIVIDGKSPDNGIPRGYTEEVLGCPVANCFGPDGHSYKPVKIGFGTLDEALFGRAALDTDIFITLSHVKGHGDCGFGGALKNIAMGVVPPETRGKLHRLEGGISYNPETCTFCLKCQRSCPNGAIMADTSTRRISFFYHHCTFCQHCIMACPEKALIMLDRNFQDFAQGMALVTRAFLSHFSPDRLFFINVLTSITMYCDCWGFSSPALVPDIGILAGQDITAVDTASLDLIRTENLLESGLPANRKTLGPGDHLFERIHGKDPYLMLRYLTDEYPCTNRYELKEVR